MEIISKYEADKIAGMYEKKCDEILKLRKENLKLKSELKIFQERYFKICEKLGLVED